MPDWTDEEWSQTVSDYTAMQLDDLVREIEKLRKERDHLAAALDVTSDIAQVVGVPTVQVSPSWEEQFRETERAATLEAAAAYLAGDMEGHRYACAVQAEARKHLNAAKPVSPPRGGVITMKAPQDDGLTVVVGYPCPTEIVLDQGMNRCRFYGEKLDNLACSRPHGHQGDHIATAGALPGAEVLAIASTEQ